MGFSTLGRNYNGWMYRVRRRVLLKTLGRLGYGRQYRRPSSGDFSDVPASILDIGVGTGFYIDFWKKLYGTAAVDGVDITDVAVKKMKERHPGSQFYVADIGEDKVGEMFGKKKYDVISAFDVLFHITNDEKYRRAIRNIYDLLEDGGVFVMSENFVHSNVSRAEFQVSRSKGHIEELLLSTGFEIIGRAPMFVMMNAPVNTNSMLMKKSWRWLTRLVRLGEPMGFAVGCVAYPVECMLLSMIREGPSTEVIVCKKKRQGGQEKEREA